MIGAKIKHHRESRGWTLRDLARFSRVDHAWLCRLESGERHNMSLQAAARVAQALGVSVDYLAGLTTDPTPARVRQAQEHAQEHHVCLSSVPTP